MPSLAFRDAYATSTSDKNILLLMKIDEDSLPAPLFLVDDSQDLVASTAIDGYAGTYSKMRFVVNFPSSSELGDDINVVIDNVDRRIGDAVKLAVGRPEITAVIVLAATPNVVEAGPWEFELDESITTSSRVSGRAISANGMNGLYPYKRRSDSVVREAAA